MQSNFDAHVLKPGLIAALAVPILSCAFAFLLSIPCACAGPQSGRILIAQAEGDAPPEINFRRRGGKFGLKAEDSNSAYGERPFRRPRDSQTGAATTDSNPGQQSGSAITAPAAVEGRRRPFAGAFTPQAGGFARPLEGGPGAEALRARMRGQGMPGGGFARQGEGGPRAEALRARLRGQGMPEGEGVQRRPPEAGKFQTSGGFFGSRKPLDFSSLQLTDEQKERIRAIRRQNAGPVKEMQKSLRDGRLSMRDLMFNPSASDDQIRSKRRDIRQMQDRVEEMQINDFLSIRHVLSPEQRQRLPDLKPGAQEAQVAGAADGGPPHP